MCSTPLILLDLILIPDETTNYEAHYAVFSIPLLLPPHVEIFSSSPYSQTTLSLVLPLVIFKLVI
jgi:hypothetical protein